ncbi:MAG: hypothetical protein NC131_11115 [Roseburia sp.]|nr:hypothetical protein [Roseburia sp.]
MYQTKVFLGTVSEPADEKFNQWAKEHVDIEIIQYRYEMTRYGDHSIALLYKT